LYGEEGVCVVVGSLLLMGTTFDMGWELLSPCLFIYFLGHLFMIA